MFGLVGLLPDYGMIVVGANMGVSRMTREHLGIALALKIPFFVVVTKIDIAPPAVLEKTMATLLKILKSPHVKKNPQVVEDDTDISTYGDQIHDQLICPIFQVSNVTGDGLAKLTSFLSIIRSRVDVSDDFKTADDPVEFLIDGDYVVTGVGLVVAGTLKSGRVKIGDNLLLGPDKQGEFKEVIVKGIHYKRMAVEEAVCGQACCFNIKGVSKRVIKRKMFRKGMMVVSKQEMPESIWEFDASVKVLHHATTITENYQAVIHAGVIRQAAKVVSLTTDLLRTGDQGEIHF